jgi:UDP-GlcNAc:undecaprenyl-phosphate GlcNAc-1-phosphate transferase
MLDPTILLYVIAGIGAFVASLAITPLVRATSIRLGFVDRPDRRRKAHKAPVALGGGAAVFVAMALAVTAVLVTASFMGVEIPKPGTFVPLVCLAIGAVSIVALGLLDDLKGLRGRYKLLGQLAIAALLVWSGIRIEGFTVFGNQVTLGWFVIPATLFWLVGTTNAVNLIDGIDGLAGSVGLILCLTLAAITGGQGNITQTCVMLALAGALLGFLRYNFAPATIYLGDAGSMLVGLACGTIAVMASAKSSAAMAFAVPIAVWSVPILDSFAALVRRKLTGRSMFSPDRGHLHHSLLVRGWSVQQAALFIALICATTCLSAVLSIYLKKEWIAIVTVIAVMIFLISTRTFGHIEFQLLKGRMHRMASSFGVREGSKNASLRESSFQLQGSREWSKLWAAIVEAAETYQLTRIKLTIDMPLLHESFYASWDTSRTVSPDAHVWRLSHPLVIDGDHVGQMEIAGETKSEARGSTLAQIGQVLDFLEPIEDDIRYIREHIQVDELSMRACRAQERSMAGPVPAPTVAATVDPGLAR